MKFYKHKSFEYFDGSFGGTLKNEDYLLARNESGEWASVSKSGIAKKFTCEPSKSFDRFILDGSWVDAGELVTPEQSKILKF